MPRGRIARAAAISVAARFSHIELVQSRQDLGTLAELGVPRGKMRHLGTGVDLSRFDPGRDDLPARGELRRELALAPECLVIGAVGRPVADGGYRELFEAFRDATAERDDIVLVVAGPHDHAEPAPLPAGVIDQARAHGVVFPGRHHDVDALYRTFDIAVLTGPPGDSPRLAMEAAAMGVPVLAPGIGGCREVVEHGRSGELLPVGNPQALAEAFVRAAADRPRLAALAAGARRKAQRDFDDRRQVKITLDAYDEVLVRVGS
jgi:glycosyltransferase involved in cell wall biosynthesis